MTGLPIGMSLLEIGVAAGAEGLMPAGLMPAGLMPAFWERKKA